VLNLRDDSIRKFAGDRRPPSIAKWEVFPFDTLRTISCNSMTGWVTALIAVVRIMAVVGPVSAAPFRMPAPIPGRMRLDRS
jgi:hypothetical protein